MKTWVSGGRQEEADEVLQALRRGTEAIHVSVSMLCEHWWPGRAHGEKKKTSGTNWLLAGTGWYCFSGSDRTGGRGWNNTQVPTLLTHTHLSIDSEAQLAKRKTKQKKHQSAQKWTEIQLFCGLHVVKKKKNNYQPANVWELHPLLMVFLMINKYVNNYGDEHKWSVFRSIVYISLNIQRDRRMLENGLRRMSEVGMDVRECAVSLWMEARLLSVNKRQCPSVCYCLQCLLCL